MASSAPLDQQPHLAARPSHYAEGGADSDVESNAMAEKPTSTSVSNPSAATAGGAGGEAGPKRGMTLKRKREALGQMRTLRKYQAIYMSVVLVQTIVVVVLASIVFGRVEEQIVNQNARLKSVTTYLAVFIMANVFTTLLSLDALQNKNTMQLFALVIFDMMMMVYGAVLPGQVKTALLSPGNTPAGLTAENGCNYWLSCYGTSPVDGLYRNIQGMVIAIPIITGVCAIAMGAVTWLLYKENGWEIFKEIGADITLKRVYQQWQIFSVLNKFNFFFFVGFSIQLLILVDSLSTAEKAVTITAVPVSILVIALAAWGVRREIHVLMGLFFLVWTGALVYYFYKLVRILSDAPAYDVAQRSLSLFAFLSIFTLLATGALAAMCWASFGKGLKQQSISSSYKVFGWMGKGGKGGKGVDGEKDEPARMTLDD